MINIIFSTGKGSKLPVNFKSEPKFMCRYKKKL